MGEKSNMSTKQEEQSELRKIFENCPATFDEDPGRWLGLVRDKLISIFRSPMKEEYSNEAFRWVSQLCVSMGDFSWITTGHKWSQEEAKMFSCIARLSLAEIEILLPPIQRHLTCGDEPEEEDGKVLDRSAKPEDYDRFGTHLMIIESVIKSLVKDMIDDHNEEDRADKERLNPVTQAMAPDDLKTLLERFKDTMRLICEYLELTHRYWQNITNDMNDEKFSAAQGALRIISVWLSEDPGGFESQCRRFLIDLMMKSLLLGDKFCKNDLIILALHSICADSDDLADSCKRIPYHEEALERYLKYVQKEQRKSSDRRAQKVFKLRCGLVKDLAKRINKTPE